ncbi:MAG: hypothetical protein IT287_04465 [Bdellovibrionaceae bacterium]|nr:hypothetical protein [Pseudobdellovibrionaceae bacterium]
MKESSFVILHDGVIKEISGTVPGKILLIIDCQYLRQKHKAPGQDFTIELSHCKKLQYVDDDGTVLTDPKKFAQAKIQILCAETKGETVEVYCSGGTLTLEFANATVHLNPTTTISIDDLETLARNYWDEWEQTPQDLRH